MINQIVFLRLYGGLKLYFIQLIIKKYQKQLKIFIYGMSTIILSPLF
jgi:hypothetical protein